MLGGNIECQPCPRSRSYSFGEVSIALDRNRPGRRYPSSSHRRCRGRRGGHRRRHSRITTAWFLKEAGFTVALVEAGRLASWRHGPYHSQDHSAAKPYLPDSHVKHFGDEGARSYAASNLAAIETIARIVRDRAIDCDFARTIPPIPIPSSRRRSPGSVRKSTTPVRRPVSPVSFTRDTPLPFAVKGAVALENQAIFHPRKYLLALAGEISAAEVISSSRQGP